MVKVHTICNFFQATLKNGCHSVLSHEYHKRRTVTFLLYVNYLFIYYDDALIFIEAFYVHFTCVHQAQTH